MKKLTIIPEKIDGSLNANYKDDDVVRSSCCYLHGELQTKNGYDIFSLLKSELQPEQIEENKWVSNELKDGIYPCVCMDEECTFFRWWNGRHFNGLVVLNSDGDSYTYAKEMYNTKAISI